LRCKVEDIKMTATLAKYEHVAVRIGFRRRNSAPNYEADPDPPHPFPFQTQGFKNTTSTLSAGDAACLVLE
jgi:hypothetical protein